MRSSITWYCIHHFSDWGRIYISVLAHKRHPISHLSGQAMGCLLWGFWKKLTRYNGTALYYHNMSFVMSCFVNVSGAIHVVKFLFLFQFLCGILFLYIWYMFMIVFCCEQLNAWHAVFHRNKRFCEIWKLVPCLHVTLISWPLCVEFKMKRIYLKCIWLLNFKQCKLLKFSLK